MQYIISETSFNKIIQIKNKPFIVQKKFESRKNNVFLLIKQNTKSSISYVLKEFSEEFKGNLNTEFRTLKQLYTLNIAVPKIINYSKDFLLLNYIPGMRIMDIINFDNNNKELLSVTKIGDIFNELGAWFSMLHFKTLDDSGNSILKGDCALKNFIYNPASDNDLLFGIDFEESFIAQPILDLGTIGAVILTIKPIFSKQNSEFFKILIESYNKTLGRYSKDELYYNNKNLIIDYHGPLLASATSGALDRISKWVSKSTAKKYLNWSKKLNDEKSLAVLEDSCTSL